ncbi:MAG: hypothetical protein ACI8XO_004927, partial [Verrucomicrobiales bacterium]
MVAKTICMTRLVEIWHPTEGRLVLLDAEEALAAD